MYWNALVIQHGVTKLLSKNFVTMDDGILSRSLLCQFYAQTKLNIILSLYATVKYLIEINVNKSNKNGTSI